MPRLLSDLPTLSDKLKREDLLDLIATQIMESEAPFAVGIHGDWGSGKTSFLKQLRLLLDYEAEDSSLKNEAEKVGANGLVAKALANNKHPIVTVWFEAWRYQNEQAPVVALMGEIRKQLPASKKVLAKVNKLGQITAKLVLGGLSDVANKISLDYIPSVAKIESAGEKWEKDNYLNPLPTDSFRLHLQTLIEQLLPQKEEDSDVLPRLVIFIDDLDRCNPDAVYKLLEGIKIYFDLKNCVFVIAMNERAVVEAIQASTKKKQDVTHLDASHYLEKICNNIWRLPTGIKPIELLANWVDDARFIAAINAEFKDAQNQDAKLEKIQDCLPPNPRRIKATANVVRRILGKYKGGSPIDCRDAAYIICVAYIYQFHGDIFARWRHNIDFGKQLLSFCSSALSDDPSAPPVNRIFSGLVPWSSIETYSLAQRFPNPEAIEIFWISSLVSEMSAKASTEAKDFIEAINCVN